MALMMRFTTSRRPSFRVSLPGAVVIAVLVRAVRMAAFRIRAARGRLGVGPTLLLGGAAGGVVAAVVVGLGGAYEDVLFSGQTALPDLIRRSRWASSR